MITYYSNWLNKTGTTQKVQRLEFLEIERKDNKYKIFQDSKGKQFLCALYRCRNLKTNEIDILKFRMEYDAGESTNDVGWNYTNINHAVKDSSTDDITCTRELYNSGVVGTNYESPDLVLESRKRYNKIIRLENILSDDEYIEFHKLAKAKLAFTESPTAETYEEFIELRDQDRDLHDRLNEILNV